MLAASTLQRLALDWSLDPGALLAVVLAGGLYAGGVRRLAARGRRWPPARSAAAAAGLAVVVIATCSGFATYDTVLFSAHSVQHVLLGMAAPLLLALGAPVTLALQAATRSTTRGLLRLLHGRPARVLAHPVVAWVLFGGTLVALYASPLLERSVRDSVVHGAVHLHVLAVGCLFCWSAVGVDPLPRTLPHAARVLFVLLAVPFHAVVGLALLSARSPLAGGAYAEVVRDWGPSTLDDQQAAAGVLWASGELFGLVLVGLVLAQWARHERRVEARVDRVDDQRRRAAAFDTAS